MNALVDALERDPEKHAPALWCGLKTGFPSRQARDTLCRDHAQTIIYSALMIHPEHIAL
jgi:hypothetical protein